MQENGESLEYWTVEFYNDTFLYKMPLWHVRPSDDEEYIKERAIEFFLDNPCLSRPAFCDLNVRTKKVNEVEYEELYKNPEKRLVVNILINIGT